MGFMVRPLIPCPICGRKTRAKHRCQWCGVIWNAEQLDKRELERRRILENYPERVKLWLKRKGYLYWLER